MLQNTKVNTFQHLSVFFRLIDAKYRYLKCLIQKEKKKIQLLIVKYHKTETRTVIPWKYQALPLLFLLKWYDVNCNSAN